MPTSYLVQNNRIQVSEMPTASSDLLGKVVQYVGESDGGNLVHGHFYTCTGLLVPGGPTTYSWIPTDVQNTYSLPTASASTLGGVKVGDNLSIDNNGVLSGAAPYSLPPASASTLGGIKVGSNLNIDNEGVLSGNAPYSLPTASDTTLGGVKVGSNLSINNGVLSVTPETISQTVSTYCAANFSEWAGALDSTLESSVMAAPANKVGEIKSALSEVIGQISDYDIFNLIEYYGTFLTTQISGVDFTWDTDTKTVDVEGTASANVGYNILYDMTSYPSWLKLGRKYIMTGEVTDSNIQLQLVLRPTSGDDVIMNITEPVIATIPSNLRGFGIRIRVAKNKVVDGTVSNIGFYLMNDAKSMEQIVTVKSDGSGDFTSLRDAVESITDASKDNPYYIEVYPGQYDLMDDYSQAEIEAWENESFGGIILTDGMNIRGVGDCHEIILNAILPTTYVNNIRKKVSTLSVGGNVSIENLTLIAENIRYCVHDAYDCNIGKYKRIVKNVIMIGKNLISGNPARTYGCGFMSTGEDSYFENVDFGIDIVLHSNTIVTEPTTTIFKNCRCNKFFFDQHYDVTNKHTVILDSCSFEGIEVSEDLNESQTVYMFGTNNNNCFVKQRTGRINTLSYLDKYPVGNLNVGTLATFNGNTVQATTDIDKSCGVVVNKDSVYYYVSTSKYINADYIGLVGTSVGDYVTVSGQGELTTTGATSENAVGVIVAYRTDNYVKMLY